MEHYDDAELWWLRTLGTPDHVLDYLKQEEGLDGGGATRITVRAAVSLFAIFALSAVLREQREALPARIQQFPNAADAFLAWSPSQSTLVHYITLLAGAACVANLICFLVGAGWRKGAGDLNVFAIRWREFPSRGV